MLRARRTSPLLLVILIALVTIPVQLVLGVERVPVNSGTEGSRMTWPEGADLLAALELDLTAGSWDWQVTTFTLDGSAIAFAPESGIIVTAAGSALVQVNDRETMRLERNAALTMLRGDRWQIQAADDAGATVLVIELLPGGMARSGDDATVIGPLAVPGGKATLVLVNVDRDFASEATRDEVMRGALRPGVSIRHDETGIPATPEPDRTYDRWIIALLPHGEQPVPVVTHPPTTPMPVASPTIPATPTVTPTSPATPTATTAPAATPTPTITPTNTPTPTPTPIPTNTPTPTPTEVPPTAADTPTPTPTEQPESGEEAPGAAVIEAIAA